MMPGGWFIDEHGNYQPKSLDPMYRESVKEYGKCGDRCVDCGKEPAYGKHTYQGEIFWLCGKCSEVMTGQLARTPFWLWPKSLHEWFPNLLGND